MGIHVVAASQDATALSGMIDKLRARGYRFATAADIVAAGTTQRYFPETGDWVSLGFYRYWQQYGGLAQFGNPISGEFQRNGIIMQYFERARFEWHSGVWPARYDVLRGLLGDEITASRRAAAHVTFQRINAASDATCTYFAETGYRLCFGFSNFWFRDGGLCHLWFSDQRGGSIEEPRHR
jgi:hypothetical protein